MSKVKKTGIKKSNNQLSNAEIASFFNQSALLFQSGFTPRDSMRILCNDCKNKEGQAILQSILDSCNKGDYFSHALSETGLFPQYVISMIALGEESGNLDSCMLSLSDYYEKEESIQESLKNAVTYPLIMIAMMIVVIFVLIGKVMPVFEQVFEELGSEVTGFAASLMSMSNVLNRYSVLFISILCILALIYIFASKTKTGKKIINAILNKIPLTRDFFDSVACGRFASGLAIALSSGMDTYTSLDMVAQLIGNKNMEEKINACSALIKSGSNFSEALTQSGIFSNLHSQMIAVGFKSGNIDLVLRKIADNYEKDTDKKIRNIISVIEPTLVIILSIIVGLILLSVILPLMGIMTSIG
jgi:type IV pilus assembly protein PilC